MSVGVTNLGTAPWAETARSGLMLGCRVEVRRAMDGAALIGTVRLPADTAHP